MTDNDTRTQCAQTVVLWIPGQDQGYNLFREVKQLPAGSIVLLDGPGLSLPYRYGQTLVDCCCHSAAGAVAVRPFPTANFALVVWSGAAPLLPGRSIAFPE
jgi:hypothetical protein